MRAIVEDCELEIVEYNDRYMKPMDGGVATCSSRLNTEATLWRYKSTQR